MKYIKQQSIIKEHNGRSVELFLDDAIKIFKTKCSDYNIDNTTIYRGIRTSMRTPYLEVSPKKYKRSAGYSNTTYLNFIDGSESWSSYPKRRESIICSTSDSTADAYGDLYVVIPFNGAKFGVCPSDDFQNSFDVFTRRFGLKIYQLDELFYDSGDGVYEYNEIKQKIETGDYNKVTLSYSYKQYKSENEISDEDMFKEILECSSPEKNGFNISSVSEIKEIPNKNENPSEGNEVWTDFDCLLIHYDYYHKFLEELQK